MKINDSKYYVQRIKVKLLLYLKQKLSLNNTYYYYLDY